MGCLWRWVGFQVGAAVPWLDDLRFAGNIRCGMNPLTQTLELVKQAQGGDRDALSRLFERYYERARRSVRARLGQKLRASLDSGDVLQQTFFKAFQIFDRFEMRHEGSLIHWLAEIAAGQIRDEADRVGSKKRTAPGGLQSLDAQFGEASGNLAQLVPGAVTGPQGQSIQREQEAAVEDCLERLPEEHRNCIVLRDYDGLEWLEVAQKLGKNTDSAARELHRRALVLLARCMKQHGRDGAIAAL